MVKEVNKIEVSFNEAGYNKQLVQVKADVLKLNRLVALCKEITSNTVNTFNVDLVDEYLKSQYTFKNLDIILLIYKLRSTTRQ